MKRIDMSSFTKINRILDGLLESLDKCSVKKGDTDTIIINGEYTIGQTMYHDVSCMTINNMMFTQDGSTGEKLTTIYYSLKEKIKHR